MAKKKLLEVDAYIYGRKIGTMLESGGRVYFEYDPAFRSAGIEISPLKLNTAEIDEAYTNPDSVEIYHGMAGVFHQSLPDKYGMPFIYRYFEQKGFKESEVTILHKLTFIADRGMGAIEYLPKEKQNSHDIVRALSAKELHENMSRIRKEDMREYKIDELMNLINGASPIGGARPKMLIAYNPMTQKIHYNGKILEPGFERSIIKFDEIYPNDQLEDESIQLILLEFLHMTLAKESGITTCEFELYREGVASHLLLKRYDRDVNDGKIHVCSAAGLLHKDISVPKVMSYEELLTLTMHITQNQSDVKELYRRMVFNALSINVDDHAKNFEFLMDKEGTWCLAPAYDITFSKGAVKEHLTTIGGKSDLFSTEDLLKVADQCLIKRTEAKEIIETVSESLSHYRERAEALGIREEHIATVEAEITRQAEAL